MAFTMEGTQITAADRAASDFPEIREFKVKTVGSLQTVENVKGT